MDLLNSGLAGLVLGFVLKTVADYLNRRASELREDRLRFIDLRIEAAADFAGGVNRVIAARRRIAHLGHMVDNVQREVDELEARLEKSVDPGANEGHRTRLFVKGRAKDLHANMLDLLARRHAEEGSIAASMEETHRAAVLIGVLCAPGTRTAASKLVNALDADRQDAKVDEALEKFVWAVRLELKIQDVG